MCNCIIEFEKRIVADQPLEKLKVVTCKITSSAFFFDNGGTRKIVGEFEIEAEGRKKPIKQNLVFGFCPMCGQKYDQKTISKP